MAENEATRIHLEEILEDEYGGEGNVHLLNGLIRYVSPFSGHDMISED